MKNKKLKNVLLSIMGVLIIIELVVRIINIQHNTVSAVTRMLSLVFLAVYGFWLYRKPHGNMLKYAMLLFALASIVSSCHYLLDGDTAHVATIIASAALCYCAGRLNRIEQNKYLLPLIGFVYLAESIYLVCLISLYEPGNLMYILGSITSAITYITIMIAYFVRYDEHKEAGITDSSES